MKKAAIYCLVLALLCGAFTACGDDKGGESSTPETAGSTTTTTTGDSTGSTTEGTDATTGTGSSETEDTMNTTTDTTGAPTTGNGTSATTSGTTKDNDTPGSTTKTTTTKKPTTSTTKQPDKVSAIESMLTPYLTAKPVVKEISSYNPTATEWKNIKAITYDGATMNGQKTKVFAYIGFPEGASASSKVPAIVLVHGGGGHAFAEWVKLWNDRGYAAIAMDTTGFFPSESGKGKAGRESDSAAMWHHGLYGEFAETGYVNAPNNDEMRNSAGAVDQQWMYHAIAATMLAQNILAGDSRVDAAKIGITGISWGGVITSLAIGYDSDYAFAIPIYGSAYLNESHAWMGPIFDGAKTKELWSAADRLDKVTFPVMWLGWSSDNCFSINSQSKSYMDTKEKGAVLNMKVNWGHSHGQGWAPTDSFTFADSIVGKRGALTRITQEPQVKKNADGTYTATLKFAQDPTATKVSVTTAYIESPLSYVAPSPGSWPLIAQTWKAVKKSSCKVENGTVTVTLPKKTSDFYIIISTTAPDGKYDVSSQFIQNLD